ncbi:MAG TPA: hypothetical protein VFW87_24180 [Pirellulales bacterium]|nr:hypothetical protein [Pirellulales bacterium]
MISDSVRQRLEAVLHEEALDDRSRFDAPGFFDEIPLYSRYRQVGFLKKHGDPSGLLIEFALEYLESVVDAKRSSTECFAAITAVEYEDAEFLVPCIYVCNGRIRSRLRSLRLARPVSKFAEALKRSLSNLKAATRYAVAQDTISAPGNVRAFIAYRRAPAENLIALQELTERLSLKSVASRRS